MKRKLTPIIDDLVREIYPLVNHDPRVTENVFHHIQNHQGIYSHWPGEFFLQSVLGGD